MKAMLKIEDRPDTLHISEEMLEGFGGFPNELYLIKVGQDRYAANNVTLPDEQKINGLAVFPSPDDATTYMGLLGGLGGDIVKSTFEDARQIAISKPILSCLLLFEAGHIIDIHYVR